jgi:lambda repressor-like predicted transcriptional regulator
VTRPGGVGQVGDGLLAGQRISGTPAPWAAVRAVPADELARLYRLGLTMAEIARIYGISAWTVAARLDQAGVVRRRANDRAAALPVEQAVRRYRRQPHQIEELAGQLGISAQLIVDRAAQPERYVRGRPRNRADVPADEVTELYRAGWTVAQIAARYQTAATTVLNRLDQAGVARRPKSTPVPFPLEEAARRVQQDGTSFAQLARDYQVGAEAISRQLKARGIHAPPATGPRVLREVPATEITGLYATGLTMAAIGARYGVSSETIRARLLAAGVTPRRVPPRPTIKPVPVGEAAARYRRGATLTELAAAYAVTRQTIGRKLAAAGVPLRSRVGGRIPIPVAEAAELYRSGQTLRQIAGRYGVCESVIHHRLTEAGVPLRRKSARKQVDPALLARLAQLVGLDQAP